MAADSDYEAGPYTVNFTAGQTNATLMVSTKDDNITELSEYFVVVINSTDQQSVVEIGTPNNTVITIEDNDPGINFMCTVWPYKWMGVSYMYNVTLHILMRCAGTGLLCSYERFYYTLLHSLPSFSFLFLQQRDTLVGKSIPFFSSSAQIILTMDACAFCPCGRKDRMHCRK